MTTNANVQLESLRRQVKLCVCACATIGGVLVFAILAGAAPPSPKLLVAQQIELRRADGSRAGSWMTTEQGSTLEMLDAKTSARLVLRVAADGGRVLLYDSPSSKWIELPLPQLAEAKPVINTAKLPQDLPGLKVRLEQLKRERGDLVTEKLNTQKYLDDAIEKFNAGDPMGKVAMPIHQKRLSEIVEQIKRVDAETDAVSEKIERMK